MEARLRTVEALDPVFRQCVAMATLARFTHFGAAIARQPKKWIALEEREGAQPWEVVACVGVWAAGQLESERYLQDGVAANVRRVLGREVPRDRMVEIGSFVSNGFAGRGSRLMRLVPIVLLAEGVDAVLCTATERVRRMFDAAAVPFRAAGRPRPECMPADELACWGRYFDATPITGWIPLEEAVAAQARWLEAVKKKMPPVLASADHPLVCELLAVASRIERASALRWDR